MIQKVLWIGILYLNVACCGGQSKKEVNVEAAVAAPCSDALPVSASSADSLLFEQLMAYSQEKKLASRPFADVMVAVAQWFSGTPYVPATLELDGQERLVVNLRAFDCTTFAENVWALSLCIHREEPQFDLFVRLIEKIRYRDGRMGQYPSRLHYFSDWMVNNQDKGLLSIVSNRFGDAPFDSHVDFMSGHPEAYQALKNNAHWVNVMRDVEKNISSFHLKYVTGKAIAEVAPLINDGDIIGFCSSVPGLDISHVAIAVQLKDGLHFIHASSSAKKVELSADLLSDYVNSGASKIGILVARPIAK